MEKLVLKSPTRIRDEKIKAEIHFLVFVQW